MTERTDETADVRDMLCAQALAHVDRAVRHLAPGQTLDIVGNGPDVQADLLAWATGLGHEVAEIREEPDDWHLQLRRKP